MTLSPADAELIINEARAQGVTNEMPEDDGEKVRHAEQVLAQAQEAYDNGVRGEHVTKVLAIRDALSPAPQGDTEKEVIEPYVPGGPVTQDDTGSSHPTRRLQCR